MVTCEQCKRVIFIEPGLPLGRLEYLICGSGGHKK
jgi:hypothetical protein